MEPGSNPSSSSSKSINELETNYRIGGEGAQQVDRRTVRVRVAIEPAVEVSWVEDDGHTVVNSRD